MKNDESDEPEVSMKIVASDEMFRVRREEQRGHTDVELSKTNCREKLTKRLFEIEAIFVDGGWPCLSRRVTVVSEDSPLWGEIPIDWEYALAFEDIDPAFESGPDAPIKIEWGDQFILRRVEPLTAGYWLIKEAIAIQRVLEEKNIDQAVEAGIELGKLREQANRHFKNLRAVRRERKQIDRFVGDPERNREKANSKRKAKADKWRSIARDLAKSHSTSKGEGLERAINRELERQGLPKKSGRSIRRALSGR